MVEGLSSQVIETLKSLVKDSLVEGLSSQVIETLKSLVEVTLKSLRGRDVIRKSCREDRTRVLFVGASPGAACVVE